MKLGLPCVSHTSEVLYILAKNSCPLLKMQRNKETCFSGPSESSVPNATWLSVGNGKKTILRCGLKNSPVLKKGNLAVKPYEAWCLAAAKWGIEILDEEGNNCLHSLQAWVALAPVAEQSMTAKYNKMHQISLTCPCHKTCLFTFCCSIFQPLRRAWMMLRTWESSLRITQLFQLYISYTSHAFTIHCKICWWRSVPASR